MTEPREIDIELLGSNQVDGTADIYEDSKEISGHKQGLAGIITEPVDIQDNSQENTEIIRNKSDNNSTRSQNDTVTNITGKRKRGRPRKRKIVRELKTIDDFREHLENLAVSQDVGNNDRIRATIELAKLRDIHGAVERDRLRIAPERILDVFIQGKLNGLDPLQLVLDAYNDDLDRLARALRRIFQLSYICIRTNNAEGVSDIVTDDQDTGAEPA